MSGFLNDTFGSANLTGSAASSEGQSAGQFAAALAAGVPTFGIQILVFLLLKDRFARIYQPRTYLVPPRERTDPAAPGWFKWVKSVLSTSNSEFVQKCGLDAYFFLRYLRTLLKIFIPTTILFIPVLLPLNAIGGRGPDYALTHNQPNVTGLDQLSWSNVRPENHNRLWVHWTLALMLVIWVCYIAFDELRNYVRMRQAYITSPQHRLRASATTVLVSSIPPKWCTVEALDGLYDVFPGGLRNIWINRNFDDLNDKVKKRDKLAQKLESAETELIRKCYKKNEENIAKAEKEAGKKLTKEEKQREDKLKDEKGQRQAESSGLTSGNPHQVKHTLSEALGEDSDHTSSDEEGEQRRTKPMIPIPVIGEGLQAVTGGLGKIGQGVLGGIRGVNKNLVNKIDTTNGFMAGAEDAQQTQTPSQQPFDQEASNATAREPTDTDEMLEPSRTTDQNNSPRSQNSSGRASDSTRVPPHSYDNEHRPLNSVLATEHNSADAKTQQARDDSNGTTKLEKVKTLVGLGDKEAKVPVVYPAAFNEEFQGDAQDCVWRKYLEEKDRETHRLPIFGWEWMFSLPLVGKKVDTIYYCREEVARLNVEIEEDQAHPERFPLLNSAFIQFNHQVAAHMACQSLSHHVPKQMDPRLVEIDPNDVIWDNMSIPWWQNYIRTAGVIAVVIGMIVLWAIPVALTSAMSHIAETAKFVKWLSFVNDQPSWLISAFQGIVPPVLLGLLMFLLPVILQFFCRLQGIQSGMLIELSVQKYYFAFLFVQLFLVVTVGGSVAQVIPIFSSVDGFVQIPNLLGITIPTVSNYFITYMVLQALSVSSGALLQVGALFSWFILAPIMDSTARSKFNRQTNLSNIQWGTFFPVYTNLACIGLIYSIISPLILIFNVVTFALFWFAYRYNTLYVTRFTKDTGGLLYPNAINFTFVGLYVAEIALIGLFFLVRDPDTNSVLCDGQAIGMIVILILTAIYHILLNQAFAPLFKYLPITLEDDAVRRDEEFARAAHHHQQHEKLINNEREDEDIEDQLEENERQSFDDDQERHQYEMNRLNSRTAPSNFRENATNEKPEGAPLELQNPEITMDLDRESKGLQITKKLARKTAGAAHLPLPQKSTSTHRKPSWADRNSLHNRRSSNFGQPYNPSSPRSPRDSALPRPRKEKKENAQAEGQTNRLRHVITNPHRALAAVNDFNPLIGGQEDLESQRAARAQLSDALFAGVNDELEDLTPDQRDTLVQRAFQHSALRARRPVIWIPRDDLGVSDDELKRMSRFSKNLWVSNVRQGLDSKGRCVYSGAPPDFSEVDLIQL